MPLWSRIKNCLRPAHRPTHLRRGQAGERIARAYLERRGLACLETNFRSPHGEIDLVVRDGDCVAFVEVKTRSREDWVRPAASVDRKRQQRLSRTALDFLRTHHSPEVKFRFDIVEVLLHEDEAVDVRHLQNAFPLASPYRYR